MTTRKTDATPNRIHTAIAIAALIALTALSAFAATYDIDYGYDDSRQLTSAAYLNITTTVGYVYDNMGNRTAKSTVGSGDNV